MEIKICFVFYYFTIHLLFLHIYSFCLSNPKADSVYLSHSKNKNIYTDKHKIVKLYWI